MADERYVQVFQPCPLWDGEHWSGEVSQWPAAQLEDHAKFCSACGNSPIPGFVAEMVPLAELLEHNHPPPLRLAVIG